jgi:uncharacterized membrane protein
MAPLRPLVPGLALLALLAVAAHAQGAPPLAQPWTVDMGAAPASAGAALALALDRNGDQALVATADAAGLGAQDNDLVRVLWAEGNVSAEQDPSNLVAEGKSSVAVSADGRFAVAGANATGSNAPGGGNVNYYTLPDLTATWSKARPEPITTVAINGNGAVVAVGTRNTSATAPGRVVRYSGVGDQVWDRAVNACGNDQGQGGSVLAMDMSEDGRWLVVGTAYMSNDGPRGCVLLFDTASLNPVLAHRLPDVGTGEVVAVDMAPNGAWFGAGTRGGAFLVFRNQHPERSTPLQDQLPALQPVRALRVSGDGATVVVADATTVARYARVPGLLTLSWVAPVSNLRSLDTTPDGEYIVVGAAQVLGFHQASNATLWGLEMADAIVRVAQPGPNDIRLVAASGTQVRGWRLHWSVQAVKSEPEPVVLALGQARSYAFALANTGSAVETFELSAGAPGFQVDVAPPRLVLRPGEQGNATITLTPGPNAEASLYRITVLARGARSGVDTSIPINATVGAVPRLGIGLVDPSYRDRGVFQGESHDVVLEVRNSGNARLEVQYELTQQPNVGRPWEAALTRTTGFVEAGGVTTNTLSVLVPFEALNGTENRFNVSIRAEGAQAHVPVRLVVNPQFTASIEVIPQSKVVAPGKSTTYSVVVANNGTLREEYRLVYCVALPDLIPCLGNATLGLGGWSVALDTSPFTLDRGQSKSFQLAIAAPRGAIPGTDKLALQVEVVSTNPDHRLRDTERVLTPVLEESVARPPPTFTPGLEAALVLAGLGAAAILRRR